MKKISEEQYTEIVNLLKDLDFFRDAKTVLMSGVFEFDLKQNTNKVPEQPYSSYFDYWNHFNNDIEQPAFTLEITKLGFENYAYWINYKVLPSGEIERKRTNFKEVLEQSNPRTQVELLYLITLLDV